MGVIPESCAVAVVGAGNMAREHVRAFRAVPGVTVAGIYSRTRERAQALAGEFAIPHVCGSLAELHEKTQARLCVVTVFETAMKAVAVEALAYPWTLLLEKPPGMDVAEAEAIQAAAAERGREVRVGLNRQFLSATQQVVAGLKEHDGPRFVKVQDQQSLALARSLGHPPQVVETWMYANSIHLVDYFRVLARGRAVEVQEVEPWNPEAPGVVLTRLRFESGDLGLYEAIWHGPGPWAASVTVPGRRWELRPLEQLTTQELGQRPASAATSPWDGEFKPGFRRQAEEVVAAALGRPSASPTLSEALQTMHLIRSIYRR